MFWKKKSPTPPSLPPSSAGASTEPPKPPAKEPIPLGKGHPGTFEGPTNRLEEVLMAYRNREIPFSAFFNELLNSEIKVLSSSLNKEGLKEKPANMPWGDPPTVFCLRYPEHSALAIYTSRDRTMPTIELHPDFVYCSTIVTGSLLSTLKPGCGLVINPYWDVNLTFDVEQVAMILEALQHH